MPLEQATHYIGNRSSGDRGFKGDISGVRFQDYALCPAEVKALSQATEVTLYEGLEGFFVAGGSGEGTKRIIVSQDTDGTAKFVCTLSGGTKLYPQVTHNYSNIDLSDVDYIKIRIKGDGKGGSIPLRIGTYGLGYQWYVHNS